MSSQAELLFPIVADEKPLEPIHDESFLTRLRDRDTAAFEQLIEQQSPAIQRLVSRLLGWQADCDDVVQDVFVAAWEKIDRFRGQAKVESWLYSITLNQCRKVRRGKGAWRKLFERLCQTHEVTSDESGHNQDATDEAGGPEVERIQLALGQLPLRDRELIVLCCLENQPAEQVASLLSIRKNTVEVRLHRARKKLKAILADGGQKS